MHVFQNLLGIGSESIISHICKKQGFPGVPEPPFLAGAGAVFLVRSGSGSCAYSYYKYLISTGPYSKAILTLIVVRFF